MHEIVINLHIHSNYSDGHGTLSDICKTAIKCGLDAIITTDHNILVQGVGGYYGNTKKKVLLITGEEVHDQNRVPQKNHLLVFGVGSEVSQYAKNSQELIDKVKDENGLSIIAHPVDPELPLFNETDISWESWDVNGFDGLELWNGLSELKTVINNRFDAFKYGFFPQLLAHKPLKKTIQIWDSLLTKGNKVVAIGGSDAHAMKMRMGFLRKTIFPYKFHFSAINTHILVPDPLSGKPDIDSQMIINSLRRGNAFIGYDLPAKTRGFRFICFQNDNSVYIGDEIIVKNEPIELFISTPYKAEITLLKDGDIIKSIIGTTLKFTTSEPGIYRTEVYKKFLGKKRGWIFSNPIYVRKSR